MGRDDRAVLIGQTGCGKTTLAEYLLNDPNKLNVIAWNPKGSDTVARWNSGFHRHGSLDEVIEAAEDKGERRIIYTPHPHLAEDPDDQNKLFDWVYTRGYTRLYIDEATQIAEKVRPSRYLTACLNRGRERGVSTLVATQRPALIPMNILSEAQIYYIFWLNMPQDRKRVEEVTGIPIEEQSTLEPFQFYYWNARYGVYPKKQILKLGD